MAEITPCVDECLVTCKLVLRARCNAVNLVGANAVSSPFKYAACNRSRLIVFFSVREKLRHGGTERWQNGVLIATAKRFRLRPTCVQYTTSMEAWISHTNTSAEKKENPP